MSVERCNHCLSPDIHKSRLHFWDLFPLAIGLRAYRCAHCFERQYRAVTPISQFVAWGLTWLDDTVNLIDPAYRQERFGNRHRASKSNDL